MYGIVKAKKGLADNYIFTSPDEIYYTKPMLPSDFLSQSIKGTTGLDWENKEFSFEYLKEYWGTWSKILNGQEVTWDKKETDLGEISITCESTDFIVLGVAQDVRVAVANAGSVFLSMTAFISSDNLFKSNVMKIITDEILNNRDNQIEITNAYKNSIASKDWKPFIRLVIEKMQIVIKGELFQKALRDTIIGIDMKNFIRFCSDLNQALDKVSAGYKVLDFFAIHFSFALAAMDKAGAYPISGMKCQSLPTNGLVAYYPFNGNANDESGNKNNGVVNKATLTTDRFGNANSAYNFNGNAYIDVNTISNSTLTSNFTLSTWVNFANFSNNYPCMIFGENQFVMLQGWGPVYGVNQKKVSFYYEPRTAPNNLTANSISPLTENKFYHVVARKSGSSFSIFVNGVLQQTLTNPNNLANGKFLRFGGGRDSNEALNGTLDDIRIYNRALSDTEIQTLAK
jgi:Concanavalin A-like lectin/glucanases superfamily